jgi:hypothetical protein
MIRTGVLLSAMALSSCAIFGRDEESLSTIVVGTVADTVGIGGGEDEAAQRASAEAAQRAMARIAESGRPGLLTTVTGTGQTTVMILEQTNGPFQTFRGTNNTSVTLNAGIVTATRGMGVDMMAQALSVPASGLFTTGSFPKEIARVQRHLDGENLLESADFLCVLERKGREPITIVDRDYATTLFEETCRNSNRAFLNRYWVGGNGVIWQSQQSISSLSGHVITQRIAASR